MSVYFVRMLKRAEINMLIGQLNAILEDSFPTLGANDTHFNICAPDGDMVFSGLRKDPQDIYICRLHKEVFIQ